MFLHGMIIFSLLWRCISISSVTGSPEKNRVTIGVWVGVWGEGGRSDPESPREGRSVVNVTTQQFLLLQIQCSLSLLNTSEPKTPTSWIWIVFWDVSERADTFGKLQGFLNGRAEGEGWEGGFLLRPCLLHSLLQEGSGSDFIYCSSLGLYFRKAWGLCQYF